MDYLIYAVDKKGKRTQLASTPSAWAAKAYRASPSRLDMEIVVFGSDGELSKDELDELATRENRLRRRF